MQKQNKRGFTIIEIIVALIIVGVMAGLAMPKFTTVIERFRGNEGVTAMMAMCLAQQDYSISHGGTIANPRYASGVRDLSVGFDPMKNFQAPYASNSLNWAGTGKTLAGYVRRNNSKYYLLNLITNSGECEVRCYRDKVYCNKLGYLHYSE